MDKRRRGRRRRVHLTICITIAATVLGFIFAQNNGNLGASNQGVDYTNSLPIDAKKPTYNRTASVEFCDDCRLNPQAGGKITSCYDRVIYLRDRYGVLEDDGRANIMQQHGDNCNITRFPVELWSPDNDKNKDGLEKDIGKFDSMFSRLDYTSLNFSTSEIGKIGSASASSKHGNLTIYIYDTIPYDMSIGLEQRMAAVYASENNTDENTKADVAILHLFRTYPGRTNNPNEADIFIVPFAHASLCKYTPGYVMECGQVPAKTIQDGVLNRLQYYKGNEKRHLFINAFEAFHTHKLLKNVPLSLSLGPRGIGTGYQIVVPYINDQHAFQPSIIQQRPEAWWTRPRKYSLTYFFGATNKNMRGGGPRIYRLYMLEEVQKNWKDTPDLGGLPYVLQSMKNFDNTNYQFFSKMYGESIFCLVLPGDSTSQKRFFDVILNGCIPVVLGFDSGSHKSYYLPDGYPIKDSYPWAKGSNSTCEEEEIDYRAFIVEVPSVESVKPAVQALMRNSSDIRRRQLLLRKYAPTFCYGLGGDAHKYQDAFSKILESLRYYVDHKS